MLNFIFLIEIDCCVLFLDFVVHRSLDCDVRNIQPSDFLILKNYYPYWFMSCTKFYVQLLKIDIEILDFG